jgi:site-specific recombinase XerD
MEAALFETILHSGMRPTAVTNIRTSSVDFKNCRFVRTWEKGRIFRDIYFANQLIPYLTAYLKKREQIGIVSDYLFTYETGKKVNYENSKRLMQRLGWQARKGRYYFATNLLEKTKDIFLVCQCLGHGDVKTTGRYIHREANTINEKLNGAFKNGNN